MNETELLNVCQQFATKSKALKVAPLGNGLINTTYKVTTEGSAPDYVLQLVNTDIFTDPEMLMNNIVAVTRHIRRKLQ